MAEPSRYSTDGNIENGVLKNKGNITDQTRLENIETLLYSDAYTHFLELSESKKFVFSTKLIFDIHHYFLNTLYDWAGKTRDVELSKGTTMFCSVRFLDNALKEFDKVIQKHFPTKDDTKKSLSEKLVIIHCEFNAIHPFREGNGRTIRLFLDLLTNSIGYSTIDYSKSSQASYINACIAGMQQDYAKMQNIIYKGLSKLRK